MKLLITGVLGQVGTELYRNASMLGWNPIGLNHRQLDIIDETAVRDAITHYRPDAVVNVAAYTKVDRAEDERELAFAVNRNGPRNLACVCEDLDILLVHLSTDYVFDGKKTSAYVEDDPVAPLNVYGESKWAGEEEVRHHCSRHIILRTSWIFSEHGNNFVKSMLRLGSKREILGVVADQHGKPTSASEITKVILAMLLSGRNASGTYHFAQPDVTNWYDFAKAIFGCARKKGLCLKIQDIQPITAMDYPTEAVRPSNSELDCAKIGKIFGVQPLPWRQSLADVIDLLKE